ncbi:ribosome biogenesis protein BMS1 homolog [Cebus imitator]|uniref:ribosome biogenesis protein BMS1 homolog n=1 Tax=Cebus imitator TaxID=2715852 RepID=UPI00080A72D2|nr:ribosome biogenesis protein BMS1 homolog [Cebus imitator]
MASSQVTLFSDSKPLGSEDIDNQVLLMPKEEKQMDLKLIECVRKPFLQMKMDVEIVMMKMKFLKMTDWKPSLVMRKQKRRKTLR